jgi:hypothetical protein
VCAPCHEYRNSLGFAVLSTYSEWKASPHAKAGKQCQTCHMSRVAGDVVDPKVQRSTLAKINLHQMPGSHSIDAGKLNVKMEVANTVKATLPSRDRRRRKSSSLSLTLHASGGGVSLCGRGEGSITCRTGSKAITRPFRYDSTPSAMATITW